MSIPEEIKWNIERIDLYHKVVIEEFRTYVQRFENQGDKEITRLRGKRNNILSGLGIALTIILGINSFYKIEESWFYFLLISILTIGLISFVRYNKIIIKAENTVNHLISMVLKHEENTSYSLGHFLISTMGPNQISMEFLNNYYYFILALAGTALISVSDEYNKLQNKKLFNQNIISEVKIDDNIFDLGIANLKLNYEKLDRSQNVPPKLLEFIDKIVSDHKDSLKLEKKDQ